MKKGEKLIYGYNDKEHMIYCTYTGEYRISQNGDIVITTETEEGSKIIADISLFQRMNIMCKNCKRLDNDCSGSFNPVYSGCIWKITAQPKRSEMAVRAGCRRCAEDGRQKGKVK